MRKRKVIALLTITLILITMGVGVFAQQPNVKSPAVEYLGFWQNTPQNQGMLASWSPDLCPICGAETFLITLSGMGHQPIKTGDILAIVDNAESVRLDSLYDIGYCKPYNTHTIEDHKNGTLIYQNNGSSTNIWTVVPKTTTTNSFVWLDAPTDAVGYSAYYQFWQNYIDGASNNYIRSYASSAIVQPYYIAELIEEVYIKGTQEPTNDIIEQLEAEAYRNGYNDGLINGTQNITALSYISEVLNGVTSSVANILDFEVMGVSITFLFSLVVAVACISLIIKIIRG